MNSALLDSMAWLDGGWLLLIVGVVIVAVVKLSQGSEDVDRILAQADAERDEEWEAIRRAID